MKMLHIIYKRVDLSGNRLLRLKGKFYRVAIRPALLYGTKCWPVKKIYEQKMEVAKTKMLRWMCGNTIIDKIKNHEFREKLGVAPLSTKCVKIG